MCIFIRSGLSLRKRPSQGWRGPFLEVLAKTRSVDKAALYMGVRRDTA